MGHHKTSRSTTKIIIIYLGAVNSWRGPRTKLLYTRDSAVFDAPMGKKDTSLDQVWERMMMGTGTEEKKKGR